MYKIFICVFMFLLSCGKSGPRNLAVEENPERKYEDLSQSKQDEYYDSDASDIGSQIPRKKVKTFLSKHAINESFSSLLLAGENGTL